MVVPAVKVMVQRPPTGISSHVVAVTIPFNSVDAKWAVKPAAITAPEPLTMVMVPVLLPLAGKVNDELPSNEMVCNEVVFTLMVAVVNEVSVPYMSTVLFESMPVVPAVKLKVQVPPAAMGPTQSEAFCVTPAATKSAVKTAAILLAVLDKE